MKKLTAVALAMLLLLSLAGCGEKKPGTDPAATSGEATKEETTETSSSETTSAEETTPAPTEPSAELPTETVPAPTESSAELPTETEPAPAERTACTTKLLEGRVDEKTGVMYFLASDGAYRAPNDFAVINEKDIVILDNVSCRLQRFKDEQYFDTVNLPEDLGDYYELCVIGDNAYVLANESLVKVDLNTKELSSISLPNPEKETPNYMGLYVNDMLEQDGKLYLVTELYGNYCLNEEAQEVVKTESANIPYSSKRAGGIDGKEIVVVKGDRRWMVNAPNRAGDVIGFGEDGIVYVYLYDLDLTREDEGYCQILKCEAGKGVIAESIVDVSKWILSSQNTFAKLGADGSVYVLALRENDFAVYKLNVGAEDIVSP